MRLCFSQTGVFATHERCVCFCDIVKLFSDCLNPDKEGDNAVSVLLCEWSPAQLLVPSAGWTFCWLVLLWLAGSVVEDSLSSGACSPRARGKTGMLHFHITCITSPFPALLFLPAPPSSCKHLQSDQITVISAHEPSTIIRLLLFSPMSEHTHTHTAQPVHSAPCHF